MKNKTIGKFIIASITLAFVAELFFGSDYATQDFIYAIAGLGMIIFGTWGAILLIKQDK